MTTAILPAIDGHYQLTADDMKLIRKAKRCRVFHHKLKATDAKPTTSINFYGDDDRELGEIVLGNDAFRLNAHNDRERSQFPVDDAAQVYSEILWLNEFNTAACVFRLLRKGDWIRLRVVADNNNGYIKDAVYDTRKSGNAMCHDGGKLHCDELHIEIRRQKQRGGKTFPATVSTERMRFLLAYNVCCQNSARMVRPKGCFPNV